MKRKKTKWGVRLMWILFLAMISVIMFLSFQNGEETVKASEPFVEYVVNRMNEKPSEQEILQLTYDLRQAARAVLFFILGCFGGWALWLTFRNGKAWCGLLRLCGISLFLLAVSYITEHMKIYIAGRHYAFDQFLTSFFFGMLGYLCISVVMTAAFHRKNGSLVEADD